MPRYALYFAPEPDSPWWRAGCQWLGRDAASAQTMPQPVIAAISEMQMHALTRDARRYGFHATLKAPFHLAAAGSFSELDTELSSFCARQAPFEIPVPEIRWMGNFLALRPQSACADMDALAMRCVSQFANFSAALSAAEMERRNKHSLSPRQRQLLQRWGYPYTEEEYRFHMTLSDAQADPASALSSRLYAAAVKHFALAEPLRVSSIALFCEAGPGEDFRLIRHYRFIQGKKS